MFFASNQHFCWKSGFRDWRLSGLGALVHAAQDFSDWGAGTRAGQKHVSAVPCAVPFTAESCSRASRGLKKGSLLLPVPL